MERFDLFCSLKPLDAQERRRIVTWDTEDDGEGHFELGAVYTGDDDETRVFHDTGSMIQYFHSIHARGLTFWAHNLEYDLNSVFGQIHKSDDWRLVRKTFGGRTLGAVLQTRGSKRQGKQSTKPWVAWCRFSNSLNIVRSSVARMGDEMGYPKLDRLGAKSKKDRIAYCVRDCEIVWRYLSEFEETLYGKFRARLSTTIGATALDVYRRNHHGITWQRLSHARDRYERAAYYGARTECLEVGDRDGPFVEYDVNSMYPWAALGLLPHPAYLRIRPPEDFDLSLSGAAEVEVEVPSGLHLPPLPFRHRGKLFFPTGTWNGVFCYPELRAALDRGCKIRKVFSCLQSPTQGPYLERFVTALWGRRAKAQGLQRMVLKDLLNNLYGKFAQSTEIEEYWFHDEADALRKEKGAQVLSETELDHRIRKVRLAGKIPLHGAPIWSAYITSYARVRLLELLEQAGRSIYCDTDSVWAPPGALPVSDELGGLKEAGRFSRVRIRAPKLYAAWDDQGALYKYAAKGIPRRVQRLFFLHGTAGGFWRAPVRWRESFGRSHKPGGPEGGDLNRWIWRYRSLSGEYDKRFVNPDGTTRPWSVEELRRPEQERDEAREQSERRRIEQASNLARLVRRLGGLSTFQDRNLPRNLYRKKGHAPDDLATELGFQDEETFLDALERDAKRI